MPITVRMRLVAMERRAGCTKFATCGAQHDIHLGIHTFVGGSNVSDFSPYMSEAVDAYLRANIDLGQRLGVERVLVHAGLHQSSELETA